jgi:hypothetical protein
MSLLFIYINTPWGGRGEEEGVGLKKMFNDPIMTFTQD